MSCERQRWQNRSYQIISRISFYLPMCIITWRVVHLVDSVTKQFHVSLSKRWLVSGGVYTSAICIFNQCLNYFAPFVHGGRYSHRHIDRYQPIGIIKKCHAIVVPLVIKLGTTIIKVTYFSSLTNYKFSDVKTQIIVVKHWLRIQSMIKSHKWRQPIGETEQRHNWKMRERELYSNS